MWQTTYAIMLRNEVVLCLKWVSILLAIPASVLFCPLCHHHNHHKHLFYHPLVVIIILLVHIKYFSHAGWISTEIKITCLPSVAHSTHLDPSLLKSNFTLRESESPTLKFGVNPNKVGSCHMSLRTSFLLTSI